MEVATGTPARGTLKVDGMTERPTEQQLANTYRARQQTEQQ